jgi:hypothetical protein
VSVAQAVLNIAGAQLRRAAHQWRALEKAAARAGKRVRRQGELLTQAPALTRARVRQGQVAFERSVRRVERFTDHAVAPYRVEQRVKSALSRAAASGRPIIAGPWISEVGYEAMYWVPFLHWAADRYGVTPDRLIAISRGGTQSWYDGLAARYVEIFDLMEPRDFERRAAERRAAGDQKQMDASTLDQEIVRAACDRLGVRDAAMWHPGLMYQLFRAFWHGDRSVEYVLRHTDFRRIGRNPSMQPIPGLPQRYAAVKFYTGQTLPDTPDNRDTLRHVVERLAARIPVVMLDMPWSVDEHRDFTFDGMPGVTTLRPSLEPQKNLGMQTAAIAGAELFVGTCGGLAWLAPLLGVDTIAVYDDDRYLTHHVYAARQVYRRRSLDSAQGRRAARFSTFSLQALRAAGAPLG